MLRTFPSLRENTDFNNRLNAHICTSYIKRCAYVCIHKICTRSIFFLKDQKREQGRGAKGKREGEEADRDRKSENLKQAPHRALSHDRKVIT